MANKGYIFVCPHCGRTAPERVEFNDVACAINALKCKPEQEERDGEMYWIPMEDEDAGMDDS